MIKYISPIIYFCPLLCKWVILKNPLTLNCLFFLCDEKPSTFPKQVPLLCLEKCSLNICATKCLMYKHRFCCRKLLTLLILCCLCLILIWSEGNKFLVIILFVKMVQTKPKIKQPWLNTININQSWNIWYPTCKIDSDRINNKNILGLQFI